MRGYPPQLFIVEVVSVRTVEISLPFLFQGIELVESKVVEVLLCLPHSGLFQHFQGLSRHGVLVFGSPDVVL